MAAIYLIQISLIVAQSSGFNVRRSHITCEDRETQACAAAATGTPARNDRYMSHSQLWLYANSLTSRDLEEAEI